jgi:hypothetical protein
VIENFASVSEGHIVIQLLHYCDQIPDDKNLRKECFILPHDFSGFHLGLLALLVLGYQYIMEERVQWRSIPLITVSKKKENNRKGPGSRNPPKACPYRPICSN